MNIPNKISLTRICLMPLFIAFFLIPISGFKFVALGIFIIAAISDAVDGHIARKYNMITNLGKFLDPIADKLLATTGLLLLITGPDPIIPKFYGIIVMFIMILRDYEVTGIRQIGQLKGVIIAADKVAKTKANFLYATLVYGLLISALRDIATIKDTLFLEYFSLVFYIFVGITTALIIISGIVYFVNNVNVFKDNEKAETASQPIDENTDEKDDNKNSEKKSTKKNTSNTKSTSKKTTSKK